MADDISFARKYRPKSLEGYIGNSQVKETVQRYLKNGRPQSILLTGNSGCGKTTMARLLVKEYLCEERDPEKGACGECVTCQMVDEYIETGDTEMIPDLVEIDASDKSGKKDIDSMLAGMEYPPMAGAWKVYIIDEVHLLTETAMGRLLKSLEEPPEGVLLIFCTTNPEKLLPTIKNRCQLKLNVTKPTTKDIIELLQRVCLIEDKNYDLIGLRTLAARSDNVIRDSLNNLERVLNTRGDATGVNVSAEFREVSDKLVFDFYKAYLDKNYFEYMNILYKIKVGYSFDQFLLTLTNFTTRGIYVLNSVDVEGLSESEITEYIGLFKRFSPKQLSITLSALKRMNVGDVEVNLMAFIYEEELPVVPEMPKLNVESTENSLGAERTFRNSNVQALENAKLKEGSKSVVKEMSDLSLNDVKELFTLEKVGR